jgi:acyl-CoA synthetase (AMP-forming)/AMP-acid ligase II
MLELLPTTIRLRDHRSGIELDHAAVVAAVMRRQAAFLDAGLTAGARVVLGHGEGAGFIVDLLAAWQIGAVVVAVTPSLTQAERRRVTAATNPALWIGIEETEGVAWLPPQTPALERAYRGDIAPRSAALDAPALVLMTSGTTSRPKGVVHSHRSLHARIALNLAYMDRRDLDRSLALMPMHFGHGLIGNCLTPLAAGANLTLWPEPGVAGFAMLAELIDAHGITFMSSVPPMWRIVLRASPAPQMRSLRRVHVGSAPLSLELWESIARWCGTRRIVNTYGTTETANWIGGHSLEDGDVADGLVGRPWGGMIRVVNSDGGFAQTGEGQVAIATPSLMTGYLDQPELTAKVVQGGWFLTGDQGAIDTDGRLRLIGRREHEINKGGIKISAEEIDLLLERHPDVVEACAFALEDPVAGEIVAVAVVPARPGALNAADLLTWCQTQIRKEALPARIFVVESLARTERGKISRNHVRAAVLAGDVTARPR